MDYNNINNNFITQIIDTDLKINKNVFTRFPPEPNGYLHIGHAKSICINFGIAAKYNGKCNLRFDDTNPLKEEKEYVQSIIQDIKWLGFDFGEKPLYASGYFDKMYNLAIKLIKIDKAYIDDQSGIEIHNNRGTLTSPGTNSPYRNRSIEENLALFAKMKNGEFSNGKKVLRAKIDMQSSNINMRDPILYRILHAKHHKTSEKWCIYPMYDWAHGIEDSIEGITHSICTLEFENHRLLYNWLLEQLNIYNPKQIEFARLNLNYTIMSKRKLKILVDKKIVTGWDDPRMPTLSGLRRRGYTPESIKSFVNKTGVVKRNGISDILLLEHSLREALNYQAKRVMVVLNPLKVTIMNYPDNHCESIKAINNPEDSNAGTRMVPFSKEIYIEKSDFLENPPKKFFRLTLGKEVRLLHAFYIKCEKIIKNKAGDIIELKCTYDKNSLGGWTKDGRKIKGTLHWVCASNCINAKINLYDRLFIKKNPIEKNNENKFLDNINKDSLKEIFNAKLEPSLINANYNEPYQFVRLGYFILDKHAKKENLIFNRSVALKDSWTKNH